MIPVNLICQGVCLHSVVTHALWSYCLVTSPLTKWCLLILESFCKGEGWKVCFLIATCVCFQCCGTWIGVYKINCSSLWCYLDMNIILVVCTQSKGLLMLILRWYSVDITISKCMNSSDQHLSPSARWLIHKGWLSPSMANAFSKGLIKSFLGIMACSHG